MNTQGLVDIGKLIFAFARVKRVTLHDDGVTLSLTGIYVVYIIYI